jgi:aldose 1-epimerase
LEEAGLRCVLTAKNTGSSAAPVGLGVHPYVDALGLVDELVLSLPVRTVQLTDESWRGVGRAPADIGTPLGPCEIDAAFCDVIRDADGRTQAVVRRPDGSEVVIWSEGTCRWWVVYTGHTLPAPDYRRSIAVEPMTCPPDALNTGEIDVLEPGAALELVWGVFVRR